ncbi:murein hydrolase activator EnvC family protein [Trichothermofontia sp.]
MATLTRYLLGGLLLLGLGLSGGAPWPWPVPAIAQPPQGEIAQKQPLSVDDLQRYQQQVEQYRSGLNQRRQQLEQIESLVQRNVVGLDYNLKTTDGQLQDSEYQLQLAEKNLKLLQADLMQAQASYQQQQSATIARLRFLQRQQGVQGLAVLLKSDNLTDFLARRHQLKQLFNHDREQLLALQTEADKLNQQRLIVAQQKNAIALIQQQILAQRSQFTAQRAAQTALMQRLQTDRQALLAAEAQIARDSVSLTQLIRTRGGTTPGPQLRIIQGRRGRGRMIYPVNAPITSHFGWRVHPILGTERFHAGTDFGADHGTPIVAAAAGTVLVADWYGGYGNAVVIDHGGGITTLYGHCSELYVTEGQTVMAGQAIAAIGSTGLSTGPHLHFEVRENGDPVDPMNYL